MAEFVLGNNYFELFDKVYQQTSGTTVTKFAPPCACIYMDEIETEFLKTQNLKPLLCLWYSDIFFIWSHGEEEMKTSMNNFNNYKFTFS